MFDKQQRKLKRSVKLISVLSKYGFQDLLTRMNIKGSFSKAPHIEKLSTPERLRLALQELGPTFVKLGQTFSNREDLLPIEYIEQLQKLQDQVETIDLDVKQLLEDSLQIVADEHFSYIDPTPFAAASIAQVYKATLLNGQPVIIKIKRPDIDTIIKDDMLLLKDLVKLIDTYSELGEQIGLKHAVLAFERSLMEELSLTKERQNILQFQRNFKDEPDCYVPQVYEELCTENILTMEFIDGIKVTDIPRLQQANIDPIRISEIGYRLYVTQLLEHGFFHADPHAGNILINPSGQVVFIDFGAMGKIPASEKKYLEALILSLMSKNASKIVRNLKKLAIAYEIPNERKFELDVEEILDVVHSVSLQDISIPDIIQKMKEVLKENRIVMPDYLYLLFKGISLMDGVGRQINPDLNVIESLKPYTKKIFLDKIDPENLAKKGVEKLTDLYEFAEELPNEIRTVVSKLYENKLMVNTEIKNMERLTSVIQSSVTNLIIAFVLLGNIIATAIIIAADSGPKWGSIPVFPVLGFLFSGFLIVLLTIRMLRR